MERVRLHTWLNSGSGLVGSTRDVLSGLLSGRLGRVWGNLLLDLLAERLASWLKLVWKTCKQSSEFDNTQDQTWLRVCFVGLLEVVVLY